MGENRFNIKCIYENPESKIGVNNLFPFKADYSQDWEIVLSVLHHIHCCSWENLCVVTLYLVCTG